MIPNATTDKQKKERQPLNKRIQTLSSGLLVLVVSVVAVAIALFDGLGIIFPRIFYISLYLASVILAIYHFHIRKNLASLVLIFLLVILVVVSATQLYYSDLGFYREVKSFPATSTGKRIFSAISTPVSVLRSTLASLGVTLGWPIGLGLGIALLVGCWTLILAFLSKLGISLGLTAKTPEIGEVGLAYSRSSRLPILGLGAVALTAFCVRLPILLRYSVPVGVDTPFYIATMEGRIPFWRYPGITRLSYHLFMILGVVLRIPFPIPQAQILFIELIPLTLHILAAVAMYGAAWRLTGDSRVGLIASTFSALSTCQLLHSWDLYKALLAISATLFAAQFYSRALETQTVRDTLLSLVMLSTAGLLHPYPASSLLYAVLSFMPIQLFLALRVGRGGFKVTGCIVLLLALVILPVLGGRLFRPWPTSPMTPIWDMWNVFDSLGAQLFPLLLVGIVYALRTGTEKNLFLLSWFAVAFIMAQQSLFLVYFSVDVPKFPRFLVLAYMPSTILAATGLRKILEGVRQVASPRLSFRIDLLVTVIIIVSCVVTATGFVVYGNPATIDMQEYETIIWMINYSPEYTNSIAPPRFDAWTGYYAGLQSQENKHFYTIDMENDRSTGHDRVFDNGTYVHVKLAN